MKTRPRGLLSPIVAIIILAISGAVTVASGPIRLASTPALSPDGKQLAFSWRGDIWVVATEGGPAIQLTTDDASDSQPEFSPDGKWLVYALSDSDFNRAVFVAPLDGSRKPFNLSMHPDNYYAPVWSPDGSMIAFTKRRLCSAGARCATISTTED